MVAVFKLDGGEQKPTKTARERPFYCQNDIWLKSDIMVADDLLIGNLSKVSRLHSKSTRLAEQY